MVDFVNMDDMTEIRVIKPLERPIVTKKVKSRKRLNKTTKIVTTNDCKTKLEKHISNNVEQMKNFKIIKEHVKLTKSNKINKNKNKNKKNGIKKVTRKSAVMQEKLIKIPTLAMAKRADILHSYLSYDDILKYLNYIKNRYSGFVTVHLLGYSYEKRAIKGIEINWNCEGNLKLVAKKNNAHSILSTNKNITNNNVAINIPKQDRNMIFIEAGTHAREWLSISVALHCIFQLTERNVHNRDILRKLRFFIVPLVNPDGYEYSRRTNPRWRKNRRPQNTGSRIIGTDCNRNFDFHWEQNQSRNKRNTYQGDKPFSEPETRTMSKVLLDLSNKLLFFLSLHSYATSIMYPWGYTRDVAENAETLATVAQTGCNAIKAFNGRQYRVGSIASLSKRVIGGSIVDYVYGVIKAPIALVMELPSNEYGFQPPRRYISSLSHESWVGIKEMCRHAYSLKVRNSHNIRNILKENYANVNSDEENILDEEENLLCDVDNQSSKGNFVKELIDKN